MQIAKYSPIAVLDIDEVVTRIWRATTEGILDPSMRDNVMQTLDEAGCKSRGYRCELNTGFYALRAAIRYRNDPRGLDLFQALKRSLKWGGGDCGSYTVAACTFFGCIGYRVGCATFRYGPTFGHVIALIEYPPEIRHGARATVVTMDLSESWTKPGWAPKPSTYTERVDFWYPAGYWADWWLSGASEHNIPSVR